jgi:hypothetical protein
MSEPTFNPTEPIVVNEGPSDSPQPQLSASAQPAPATQEATDGATQTAMPASPQAPAHVGMSVDERAYQQYQSLAQVVLDSADIATQSAQAAASASSDMRRATNELRDLTDQGHKKARLLLAVTGGVMLVSLLFFLVMGVRMNSRINQLDAMLMAVGKRVVDMNAGMESLDVINRSIESLTAQQSEQAKSQGQIEGRINEALKKSETLVQTVPGETAKQVAASSDNLLKQVQGINSRLQSQAGAVQSLGNEVKALKGAVGNVDKLNRDVEALVTLQKERYLETLQKNSANTNRERAVQFPRVNPATSTTPTKPLGETSSLNSTTVPAIQAPATR